MPDISHSRSLRLRIVAAYAAVYVIWGSTYLGILYAIETMPPFLMAGVRFLTAGGIVYAVVRAGRAAPPTRAQWRSALVSGTLLLVAGNGAVVWAELTVPSGVVSLIVAMLPVWMVLLEWAVVRGARPASVVFAGLAMGLAGLALLIGLDTLRGEGPFPLSSALVVLGGSVAWAAGSIYARSAEQPAEPLLGTGMQMLAGGAGLVALAVALGEPGRVNLAAITGRSWAGLLYLIVFGSLVGYTCYIWLLRVSTPVRVSTYAYVNPVVAVFLGWMFADETITSRQLAGAAIIIAAVALIVSGTGRRGRQPVPAAGRHSHPRTGVAADPAASTQGRR